MGPSRAGDSAPASPTGAPAGRVEPTPRQDSHTHPDQVEGQRTGGQTLLLVCTGLKKQPAFCPSMPRVPGDERLREIRAPERDSGPAWDHLQWLHYALNKPSQPPRHVLCGPVQHPTAPQGSGNSTAETAGVSFSPFPADPAQDFSAVQLEARGCHPAEMALPSHWSLQSPACEPSTSPAVRRPGHTHGARACWLFTNPLAASLWRCNSKNTPNRCPQGVPTKGRAAAETVMRTLLLRGKRQLPAPTPSTTSLSRDGSPAQWGCGHRYTHLPMGTAFCSH